MTGALSRSVKDMIVQAVAERSLTEAPDCTEKLGALRYWKKDSGYVVDLKRPLQLGATLVAGLRYPENPDLRLPDGVVVGLDLVTVREDPENLIGWVRADVSPGAFERLAQFTNSEVARSILVSEIEGEGW